MMKVSDTIQRIRQFRDQRGLRNATLARMAGLHPNTLRDMDEPDWSPRLRTLEALETVVDQHEAA